MGDNVCVSNQHPFRDWPARIPNVGVLPSREASSLVAEIGLSSSLLSVWCVGDKELSLFGPNNSLDIAINDHEPFFTCELDE